MGALQVSYERGSAVSRDATYFAGVLFHFEVGHPDVPFQHHLVVAPEVTLGTGQTLRRRLILSRDGSCVLKSVVGTNILAQITKLFPYNFGIFSAFTYKTSLISLFIETFPL